MSAPDSALPVVESWNRLVEMEQNGRVTLDEGQTALANEKRASVAAQQRRDAAFKRIEPLVKKTELFHKETRFSLIRERAAEVGCSVITLLKDLRRYWFGGQTRAALLANFHRCGYKDASHRSTAGRKPSLSSYDIYQITQADEVRMHAVIKNVYLRANGLNKSTITDAYDRLLQAHYSYNDGNGKRHIKEKGERPTYRQFSSFLHKHYSFEAITRRRKGNAEFERDFSAKLGSALQDCLGVGHMYEIDATIIDVYAVSKHDRSRIIGKPTLYLIVDRRSRLIVGFYVGLEAPSWPAAMHAILSIAEDKAALCARYGVEYSPADWPAHGIFPGMFLADRGPEMTSKNSSNIVTGLGITVANLPPQRPDYKPNVECGFKLLHRSIADATPGYEPPANVMKRQGKKYDKDACLTLDELISIILKAIISYNKKPMPGYELPVADMLSGVLPVPAAIWAREAPARAGALTRYSVDFVRFSLLPDDKAVVTGEGIRFKGCYYKMPTAEQNEWFVRARKGTYSVSVSYDRRIADSIYIHDERDPQKYYVAKLKDKCADYLGLSFAEVEAYEAMKRKQQPVYEQMTRQLTSELHEHADEVAAQAKKLTLVATQGKSRSARKADTAEERQTERRLRRQVEAAIPDQMPTNYVQHADAIAPRIYDPEPCDATSVPADSVITPPRKDKPLTLPERLRLKRMEIENETA
ncbi:transcriptional antiterminator [Noviherbaspirillum aridicola]|nr:transcriptional antiterminator [Noviherbaspirillum aridicola]